VNARLWLVVPAAGQGRRMGADRPKQYLSLAGLPVLACTLARLHQVLPSARLCLCLDPDDDHFDPAWVPFVDWRRTPGGTERVDSVINALDAIAPEAAEDDLVLVHDVARPCVSVDDLARLLAAIADDPVGGLLAAPVADTMKRDDGDGRVRTTESRDGLWHAFTPQGFRYGLLRHALGQALASGLAATDEASAVEAAGFSPRLISGRRDNLKITHPEDLVLAERVLSAQARAARVGATIPPEPSPRGANSEEREYETRMMRIGHGFDVHRFGEGDHLMIGGVAIPFEQGFIAHSDGDVLLHAVCDALLGACALGDIGRHFPDTDPAWAGADSRELLRRVVALVHEAGYRVGNVDATLIAQRPKMAPHVDAMAVHLADDLGIARGAVNVKATTTERLGFAGRGEGIAAEAVSLLVCRDGNASDA